MSASMLRQGEGASARFDAAQIVQVQRLLLSGRMAGMARRAAKVDTNHAEIRDALRKRGAWVFSTAEVGRGFPDLVACDPSALCGSPPSLRLVLLEVKRPGGRMTDEQERWHAAHPGAAVVVTTIEEAVAAVFGCGA